MGRPVRQNTCAESKGKRVETTWFYVVWIVGAYFLGSVSVGDLVCRAGGYDIRALGTGNPGTANIVRELGSKYGIAVFLLDIAKGAATTVPLLLLGIEKWVGLLAMVTLLTGQFFPIFWRFRGGTGMAAFFGTTAGLLPIGVPIGAAVGFLNLRLTRSVGWSGGVFMFVTALAGGLILRDVVGIVAVTVGGGAVFIRQVLQYRNVPPPEERPHLPKKVREKAGE